MPTAAPVTAATTGFVTGGEREHEAQYRRVLAGRRPLHEILQVIAGGEDARLTDDQERAHCIVSHRSRDGGSHRFVHRKVSAFFFCGRAISMVATPPAVVVLIVIASADRTGHGECFAPSSPPHFTLYHHCPKRCAPDHYGQFAGFFRHDLDACVPRARHCEKMQP
jgi:hypothetical protein